MVVAQHVGHHGPPLVRRGTRGQVEHRPQVLLELPGTAPSIDQWPELCGASQLLTTTDGSLEPPISVDLEQVDGEHPGDVELTGTRSAACAGAAHTPASSSGLGATIRADAVGLHGLTTGHAAACPDGLRATSRELAAERHPLLEQMPRFSDAARSSQSASSPASATTFTPLPS